MAQQTFAACLECDEDLEHCHGVAIIVSEGIYECSDDPDCQLGIELHFFMAAEA
jgi:hypothetical protein